MRVDGPLPRTEEADGMVTSAPGLALCIRWADCQNFIVYAPQRNVAGVLHAGWRGLQAGAIPAFFHTLEREWGILPADTIVGAGPSLCQRCSTFSRPAEELPSLYPRFFDANHADLQGAATDQLLALGVEARNIERHPDCTCCDPETYWTSRGGHREEVQAGRTNMLAVVLL
jgi:copper oxidase (laccase) domain-containing protein